MARAPWDIGSTGSFAGDLLRAGACFDPLTLTAAIAAAAPSLSTIGTVAAIGGSVLSGLGQIQAGKAANVNAKFQAAQLEQQAGQERASSQRVAIEERRRAAIASSNAQAAAASSGGGATDPTVLNITGGIAEQGEYNALSALFEGEERARGLNLQATSRRMEGKQARKAGYISGASTIIGGAGNALMAKYGPTSAAPTSDGYGNTPWMRPGNVRPAWAGGGYYG